MVSEPDVVCRNAGARRRHERGILDCRGQTSLGARLALWGGRELVALVFALPGRRLRDDAVLAYHFHRLAPYGVLANLLAMPVVSGFVMPAGLLALLAMPVRFPCPVWRLMGYGIDWMTAVALWVAGLPGAVGRIPAFGIAPLLVRTGAHRDLSPAHAATLERRSASRTCGGFGGSRPAARRSDLRRWEAVAVRKADGRLAVLKLASQSFAPRDWLGADGDARTEKDKDLASGFQLRSRGLHRAPCRRDDHCRRANGRGICRRLRARRAHHRPTTRPARRLRRPVGDREHLRGSGALALRWAGRGWR
ncbi:MAG: ComEC/Rec2 family competence protein [Xanthobacteraceae bacterium]